MRGKDQSGRRVRDKQQQAAHDDGCGQQEPVVRADDPARHVRHHQSDKADDAEKGDDHGREHGCEEHADHADPFHAHPQPLGGFVSGVNGVVVPAVCQEVDGSQNGYDRDDAKLRP